MNMNNSRRYCIAIIVLTCALLFCTPVIAADSVMIRTIAPASPHPGESVSVTLSLPPAFFGGVIEQLPEGFTFMSTSHPNEGVRQKGQTIIFSLTGQNTVQYTIRAPSSGCGLIQGRWENVGTKATGTIPTTVITVAGTDLSRCNAQPHTPGFGIMTALVACTVVALILKRKLEK